MPLVRPTIAFFVAGSCLLALLLRAEARLPGSTPSALTGRLSALPTSGLLSRLACSRKAAPHALTCFGIVRSERSPAGLVLPLLSPQPQGYGPDDLQSAYRLEGTSGHGRTVAIVDAYDDPRAESDLAVYRSHFGLPACTVANGCFRKLNQAGVASPLPEPDFGWAEEVSLDLDMVSATCPDCHIALVEANSADFDALSSAERTAASLPGVVAVSNSFGSDESSASHAADAAFRHAGVAITASAGDRGFAVNWPASSPYVTAVGGTSLLPSANARGWSETVWDGTGSGCSAWESKPSWQHDPDCHHRTVADVAAVADPNTGVAVYDTYAPCTPICPVLAVVGSGGPSGWMQVGGTSVGAPIIAAMFALAGNSRHIDGSYPYRHANAFFDITVGSNGDCSRFYTCTARVGYDGPTGLGTPNGVGGF